MKCWVSAFNAQGLRVIVVVACKFIILSYSEDKENLIYIWKCRVIYISRNKFSKNNFKRAMKLSPTPTPNTIGDGWP
jgi:hypothetical protein